MKGLFGGIDIGSENHHVIIMDGNGKVLHDRKVAHSFREFREVIGEFRGIEEKEQGEITFAIEGKNGYGAPLDRMLLESGYKLYNVDNLKLKQFRDVSTLSLAADKIMRRTNYQNKGIKSWGQS